MSRLVDEREMRLIYDGCVSVYNNEITASAASKDLVQKTPSSEASLKMYFNIYACMRGGTCYKMGTSASFTRFLIVNIFKDNGQEALFKALASAKQNAEYRISCGNEQPGIEATCRELINELDLPITYEELNQFYGEKQPREKKPREKKPREKKLPKTKKASNLLSGSAKELSMSVSYGSISFKASGPVDTVLQQLKEFSSEVLPTAAAIMMTNVPTSGKEKKADKKQPRNRKTPTPKKASVSIGNKIITKHPDVVSLSSKMDFKARMIPLLFLSDEGKYQKVFSIRDIQQIMLDALGEHAEKKQIEDVFARRPEWFEKVNQNPRKYKLLEIAKDYARNVLSE